MTGTPEPDSAGPLFAAIHLEVDAFVTHPDGTTEPAGGAEQ